MFEAWVERWAWSLGIARSHRTLFNMPFTATGSYTLSTAVIRSGGTVLHIGSEIGTAAALAGPARDLTHLRIAPLELRLVLDILPPGFAKPTGLTICAAGKGGEEAVAFVVSRGKLEHDELARYCTERLPQEKLPRHIYYLSQMPQNEGGKIDLVRLRAIAAGGPAPG